MNCEVCGGMGEVVVGQCRHGGLEACPECGPGYAPCDACDDGHAYCDVRWCRNRAVEAVEDEYLCQSHAARARGVA